MKDFSSEAEAWMDEAETGVGREKCSVWVYFL